MLLVPSPGASSAPQREVRLELQGVQRLMAILSSLNSAEKRILFLFREDESEIWFQGTGDRKPDSLEQQAPAERVARTFIVDEQDFGLESLEGMREVTDEGDLHPVTRCEAE